MADQNCMWEIISIAAGVGVATFGIGWKIGSSNTLIQDKLNQWCETQENYEEEEYNEYILNTQPTNDPDSYSAPMIKDYEVEVKTINGKRVDVDCRYFKNKKCSIKKGFFKKKSCDLL